jgi:hypothetical protein
MAGLGLLIFYVNSLLLQLYPTILQSINLKGFLVFR